MQLFDTVTDLALSAAEYYASSEQLCALRRRRAERLRRACVPSEPEVVTTLSADCTAEELERVSHGFTRPFVVRGALGDSAAVDRWSAAYLAEQCGDHTYEVTVASADRANNRDVSFERMSLARLAEALSAGATDLELELCSELFLDAPHLVDELGARPLFHRLGLQHRFELAAFQLFMQPRGACTDLHAAFGGNLFLNVRGRKRWLFIHPRFSPLLHAHPKPVDDSPIKPFFHLDCIASARDGDALLSRIPRSIAVLEPGDVLFNPPWWWHAVFSEEEENIAVATRVAMRWWDWRLTADPNLRTNPGYTLLSVYFPLRAMVAAMQVRSLLTTGDTRDGDEVMAELFRAFD